MAGRQTGIINFLYLTGESIFCSRNVGGVLDLEAFWIYARAFGNFCCCWRSFYLLQDAHLGGIINGMEFLITGGIAGLLLI